MLVGLGLLVRIYQLRLLLSLLAYLQVRVVLLLLLLMVLVLARGYIMLWCGLLLLLLWVEELVVVRLNGSRLCVSLADVLRLLWCLLLQLVVVLS